MKKLVFPLILAVAVAFGSAQRASAAEPPSLAVLLSDAMYALNRYEELYTPEVCSELHSYRNEKSCNEGRREIEGLIAETKISLLRAEGSRNPRPSDLLNVSDTLEQVDRQLYSLAGNETFTNQERDQYLDAAVKVQALAEEHLSVEAVKRVVALEERTCAR